MKVQFISVILNILIFMYAYRPCIIVMCIQTVGLDQRLKTTKKSKLFCTLSHQFFIAHIVRGKHRQYRSFSIIFTNMVVAVLFEIVNISALYIFRTRFQTSLYRKVLRRLT